MEEKLERGLTLPCYMADCHSRLRPASFFDLAQDMALLGGEQLGFGESQLSPLGIVWVLARMEVRFVRDVWKEENIRMETWHRGLQGPFLVRDYRLIGSDGEPSVISSSSWILMELESRKALRPDQLPPCARKEAQCEEAVFDHIPGKVVATRGVEVEKRCSKRVNYSDVDSNLHANNAKYIVWAMDCLPDELAYSRKVEEMSINFNREALPGEVVDLYHIPSGDTHYIEGRIADRQIFIVRITFSQDAV